MAVFVASTDPAFRALVAALRDLRPDASLLHLPPREAYAALGVLSPRKGMLVIHGVLLGLPLFLALVLQAI